MGSEEKGDDNVNRQHIKRERIERERGEKMKRKTSVKIDKVGGIKK